MLIPFSPTIIFYDDLKKNILRNKMFDDRVFMTTGELVKAG